MNSRDVAPALQRKAAGPILPPQIPELVVIDRRRRQVVRKKTAELGAARFGPRGEVDDRHPPRCRARPARQLVQGLLRRQTLVVVPEPAEIAASLLIGKPPQKGLPVRVVAVRSDLL